MTVRLSVEFGAVCIDGGDPLPAGQVVELEPSPALLTASSGWRVLVEHIGAASDPAYLVDVMYDDRIGERHSITPRAASRFGCSVVIEAETGDSAVIYRTQPAAEPTSVASASIPAA